MSLFYCRFKHVWIGFLIFVGTVVLQYSPEIILFFHKHELPYKVTGTEVTFDLSSLREGKYFVTIGRTRAPTDLYLDDQKVQSTLDPLSGTLSSMALSAAFEKKDHLPKSMTLKFRKSPFHNNFTHYPQILEYSFGKLFHFWVLILDVYLGIGFSLFLLLLVFLSKPVVFDSPYQHRALTFFSVTSVFYCLSLAYVTSMFLKPTIAMPLHYLLKNCFSLFFLLFVGTYLKNKSRSLIILHILCLTFYVFSQFIDPKTIRFFYNYQYVLFPLTGLYLFWKTSTKLDMSNKEQRLLSSISFSFFLIHLFDLEILQLDYSSKLFASRFLSHGFVASITLALALLVREKQFELRETLQTSQVRLFFTKQFVSTAQRVAHDIRSPILSLAALVEQSRTINSEERKLLSFTMERIKQISTFLTSESKKYSQGEEETPALLNISLHIENLIKEKQALCKKKIAIELSILDNCYLSKENISDLIANLSNLIDNSIESIEPDSEGLITVTVSNTDDSVSFAVTDNGKGIPEGILSKLTRERATFFKKEGSGLGLYHARRFAESLGGSIEIHSEVKKGTTVTLCLPLAH
ncbi:MAG: sensor histidine kinase [Bacteriovoracia bacterium]